ELAAQINGFMPQHVADKVTELLNAQRKAVRGAQLLVLGVAYKRDVNDTRDSPALEILRLLRERGAEVEYHDPFVKAVRLEDGTTLKSVALTAKALRAADCVLLLTDHSHVDYKQLRQEAALILDTRNCLARVSGGRAKVHLL